MSWQKILEIEARLTALEGGEGVDETEEEYEDAMRRAQMHETLDALVARLDEITKRFDDIELKVNLARPGKRTQRNA